MSQTALALMEAPAPIKAAKKRVPPLPVVEGEPPALFEGIDSRLWVGCVVGLKGQRGLQCPVSFKISGAQNNGLFEGKTPGHKQIIRDVSPKSLSPRWSDNPRMLELRESMKLKPEIVSVKVETLPAVETPVPVVETPGPVELPPVDHVPAYHMPAIGFKAGASWTRCKPLLDDFAKLQGEVLRIHHELKHAQQHAQQQLDELQELLKGLVSDMNAEGLVFKKDQIKACGIKAKKPKAAGEKREFLTAKGKATALLLYKKFTVDRHSIPLSVLRKMTGLRGIAGRGGKTGEERLTEKIAFMLKSVDPGSREFRPAIHQSVGGQQAVWVTVKS